MMLKLQANELEALQVLAQSNPDETCAVGLVFQAQSRCGDEAFVVREFQQVPAEAYLTRTSTAAVLSPEFCVALVNKARAEGAGVLLAHTHGGEHPLDGFSVVDDDGEGPLAKYFEGRVSAGHHFSAVVTARSIYARRLGKSEPVRVTAVGQTIHTFGERGGGSPLDRYDRQIRAFGLEGQRQLQQLRVAIVGLGGTGSVVTQQLAHLGVSDFLLIDPDTIDETNLNRLVGATPADVDSRKVDIACRHIRSINPAARCNAVQADVADDEIATLLCDVDFIFACTDSMASRSVVNQLAYQYLVPCIDIGVGIGVSEDKLQYIAGRVQMLAAGLPCLVCTDKLDAEQVRREFMTEAQRKLDPYITGASVPQPAVISLNSTLSSAAVTMFLAAMTGIPAQARMLTYDGMRGSLRPAVMDPRSHCIVCSNEGSLARGDNWQRSTRKKAAT